jgi:hypothetical protein
MARIGTLNTGARAIPSQTEQQTQTQIQPETVRTARGRIPASRQGQGQTAAMQGVTPNEGAIPSALQKANRLGQSFGTGAVDILGLPISLPVDLINSVLPEKYQQLGSSSDFRRLGNALGITFKEGESPEGFGERIAYEVGAISLPTAAVLRAGRAPLTATEAIRRGAEQTAGRTGALTRYSRSAAQRPLSFVAAETTAATGAGAGGGVADVFFPEDETMETIGQLAGGFTPSFLKNFSFLGRVAGDVGRFVTSPLTGERSRRRAATRLQSEVADPSEAAEEIQRRRGQGLTPSRATGESNLIAIEDAVRRKYPEVEEQISEDLSSAVDQLTREAREIGNLRGEERVRELLTNRKEYLLGSLEVEAAKAGEAYANKLATLGVDTNSRQIQSAFDDTVGRAYDAARATERQLWNNVNVRATAQLDNSSSFINSEIKTRSEAADPEDIPSFVEDLLDVEGQPTVNYLQDFRSRVLQNIRAERAKDAPNRNKIRILSNLQENLLQDMQSSSGQSEAIDSALAYSRDLNGRFMQGKVGKMLGFERTGASRVAPEDSIDFILSGGTPATNVQNTLRAVPEATEDISNFLKNQYAVTSLNIDGTINKSKSQRFFNKYSDVIDQIDGLRVDLEGASQAGARQEDLLKRKEKLAGIIGNRNKSVLSLYLNEPVEDAMDSLFKSKNAPQLAANLRRRVQGDKEALEGLKYSYVEYLLRKGKGGRLDEETGEAILSGPKMLNELSSSRKAAQALGLNEQELKRAEEIARSISRANRRGPPVLSVKSGEIVGDIQNYFLDSVSAFVGARLGAQVGGATAGGSIQAASRGASAVQKLLRLLTKDKAEELLVDAMTDSELYRDLLMAPTASPKRQAAFADRLRAYIPSAAAAEVRDDEEKTSVNTSAGRIGTLPQTEAGVQ